VNCVVEPHELRGIPTSHSYTVLKPEPASRSLLQYQTWLFVKGGKDQKGVNKMEKKKEGKEESPIPMLILIILILLGGILLAGLIIFSE